MYINERNDFRTIIVILNVFVSSYGSVCVFTISRDGFRIINKTKKKKKKESDVHIITRIVDLFMFIV